MSETSLPRVLVVTSNNFNLQSGGGITLTNLFRGWPADRLANLHEDPTPPDRSVCTNFFQLTGREVHWSFPFSLFERGLTGRGAAETTTAMGAGAPTRTWKRRLLSDGVPRSVSLTPELTRWIDAFKPDLVYGFLGSIAQIRLTQLIADRWQAPVALHIMDDWPSSLYTEGALGLVMRPILLREFRAMLDRSAARLAIADHMAREYERRYGGEFGAFANALDLNEWRQTARTSWSVGSPAIVRYIGSILAESQRDAIRDVCESVRRLRERGRAVTLSVHSPAVQTAELRAWGFSEDILKICPAPASHDVPGLMASADVLLLPFNFDEASVRYTQLSMPTKIPAYMISGTPVLVYGPETVAAVRYAVTGGWADAVTTSAPEPLDAALDRLITDAAHRERLGRAAQQAATRHEITTVRRGFWAALTAAAAKGGRAHAGG